MVSVTSHLQIVATFQHSQIPAVTFIDVSANVNVSHCNFLSNKRMQLLKSSCGVLQLLYSGSNIV